MPFVASTARAEPPFAISPGPVETAAQTAFRTLSVEFGLEGETLYRRDIERVRGRHLRTVESEQDFTMSLAGELGPRVDFNFEIQGAWALNATNEIPGYASFGFVKRGETWIRARDLLGEDLALKVGRFEFRDLRGWWWDEDLDAVEIRWRRGPLALSVAGGTEVASDGTDERVLAADRRGVWRVFGHAVWRAGPAARLEAFFLHAFDRSPTEHLGETTRARDVDPVDADLYWVGLRSTGEVEWEGVGALSYWIDTAGSFGRQTFLGYEEDPDPATGRQAVEAVDRVPTLGFAVDAGATWTWAARLAPRATVAAAWASGPRFRGGTVRRAGFTPTGLAGNSAPLGGVREFRYYGELLDPELSNLAVLTGALGFQPLPDLSVDLVFHAYWQDKARPSLTLVETISGPSPGLEAAPEGRTRYLGEGWDLVLGYVLPEWIEVKLALSAFRAGAAYEAREGQWAWGTGLEIEFGWELTPD